jgi:hypothetical protein
VSPGAGAGQLELVLETIPLLDLFKRLSVDGTYAIDGAALAELVATSPKQAPAGPSPSRGTDTIQQPQIDDGTFMIGPFKCKKDYLSGGAVTATANFKLRPDMSLAYKFTKNEDTGDWTELMVKVGGTLTASGTGTLTFAPKVEAKFQCDLELYKVPVPLGGPLAAVLGFKIPLGIGGDVAIALEALPLKAGFELRGESKINVGFQYTPAGGTKDLGDSSNKFELTPNFEVPASDSPLILAGGIALGGTAGLDLGVTFGFGSSLSLLKASLRVKASAKLGTRKTQFDQASFFSNYDIRPVLEVGAGKDVAKALKWLGGAVVVKPGISIEFPVFAESPRGGSFVADKMSVEPGTPVKMTVTLKPDSIKFLGIDNVVYVSIWGAGPGVEDPVVLKVFTASPGQTTFSWDWDNAVVDIGATDFFAHVESKLAPGIAIAVGTPLTVHVGKTLRWRGTASFTEEGSETRTSMEGTSTSSIKASLVIKGEHASDDEARGGHLTLSSLEGSYVATITSDTKQGSSACPVSKHSVRTQTHITSDTKPRRAPTLYVYDNGTHTLLFEVDYVPGEIRTVVTYTCSGDPQICTCPRNTDDKVPYTWSWGGLSQKGTQAEPYPDKIEGSESYFYEPGNGFPKRTDSLVTWSFSRI